MKVLFLDDRQERIDVAEERYKDDELTIVRTAEEAIEELKKRSWNLVCLDHDLGGEAYVNSNRKDCGMEVVRWMISTQKPVTWRVPRMVIIHSSNLVAAMEMHSVLNAHGYRVIYKRFRYE